MNFVDLVKQALDKRGRILSNKKEELSLLENRKVTIDNDLKETEANYFKYADDEVKVGDYEKSKEEKNVIDKKIAEVKNQLNLLQGNFYIDYDMTDIEKELRGVIAGSGVDKDLAKVDVYIAKLKELATEIEAKRNNISMEFGKYIQAAKYLPDDKQVVYEKEIKDLQEKELTMKIANSDITAFMDYVQGYYRKHNCIFK